MVQSGGNGNSENPEISVSFEPLNDETMAIQDKWMRKDEVTGERELSFGEEVRDELGMDSDDYESESN